MSIIIQTVLNRILRKKKCRKCGRILTPQEAKRGNICTKCEARQKDKAEDKGAED